MKMSWIVYGFLGGGIVSSLTLPFVIFVNAYGGRRNLIYPKQIIFLSIPPATGAFMGYLVILVKKSKYWKR